MAATADLRQPVALQIELGEFVEARFSIDRQTRSLTFASGTAFVGSRPIATAKGIWKMLGEH